MDDFGHGDRGGGSLHALATSSAHGFQSSTDKAKQDATTGTYTSANATTLAATIIPAYTAVASFSDSWVNYGAGYPEAGYLLDRSGFVWLIGLVKSGTIAGTVFTLPEGYRPVGTLHFPCVSNGAFGLLAANASGTVRVEAGNNTYVDLSSVRFRIA